MHAEECLGVGHYSGSQHQIAQLGFLLRRIKHLFQHRALHPEGIKHARNQICRALVEEDFERDSRQDGFGQYINDEPQGQRTVGDWFKKSKPLDH